MPYIFSVEFSETLIPALPPAPPLAFQSVAFSPSSAKDDCTFTFPYIYKFKVAPSSNSIALLPGYSLLSIYISPKILIVTGSPDGILKLKFFPFTLSKIT